MRGDPRLAALGFLTVGERFDNANDVINDRIDVVSKGFRRTNRGLRSVPRHTVRPGIYADYYALHGVFASITEPGEKSHSSLHPDPRRAPEYEQKKKAHRAGEQDIYFNNIEHWLSMWPSKPTAYLKAALLREDRSEKAQQERDALLKSEQLDGVLAELLTAAS
jgi:hypothetical protein